MQGKEPDNGFLAELIRRRVIKVLALYGGGAWVLIELITAMTEAWGWPVEVTRVALLSFIVGFPLVAVLAWLYDVRDRRIYRVAGSRWRFAVFAATVLALTGGGLWVALRFAPDISRQDSREEAWLPDLPEAVVSVAVLPFLNMSADQQDEYFSDGISEELLNALARVPGLRVPSRTSSFAFKGKNLELAEIARRLRVGLVLEGSVRKAGNRIRITTQLVDVESDRQVWSEAYDRDLIDIFEIQSDIAQQISKRLVSSLAQDLPVTTERVADFQAYDRYLQARQLMRIRGPGKVDRAIALLEEAIAIDPEFASGHAVLASAHVLRVLDEGGIAGQHASAARAAAESALSLSPEHPVALSSLGKLAEYEFNWGDSRTFYERALRSQPNDATTRHWYSVHLMRAGLQDASLAEVLAAIDLDPQNRAVVGMLVSQYLLHGERQMALDLRQKKTEEGILQPSSDFYWVTDLLDKYVHGQYEAVRELFRQTIAAHDLPIEAFEPVLKAIGALQFAEEAQPLIEQVGSLPQVNAFTVSLIYLLTGTPEKALGVIRESGATEQIVFATYMWFPAFSPARQLEGFTAFVEDIGLGEYWREHQAPPDCRQTGGLFRCQ